jgi:hypothetical protein
MKLYKTVKCPVCKVKGFVRKDYDFNEMRCCTKCGSDFHASGEITYKNEPAEKETQTN